MVNEYVAAREMSIRPYPDRTLQSVLMVRLTLLVTSIHPNPPNTPCHAFSILVTRNNEGFSYVLEQHFISASFEEEYTENYR